MAAFNDYSERFLYVIEKLGLSDYKVWNEVESLSKATMSKIRRGICGVSMNTLCDFVEKYPQVNADYVLTGRGSMFTQEQGTNESAKAIESNAQPLGAEITMLVPLVNQYAYAGYLSGYQDNTYLESLPTIPFTVDHEARGNYVAFEVKGDSMNNGTEESYLEGDKLFCREIPQHLWVDSKLHIRKWDFVIVHEDGILVKRIIDHDVENHTITIHSLNDFYPDKVIDLAEVRQIFNVVEMQRPKRR